MVAYLPITWMPVIAVNNSLNCGYDAVDKLGHKWLNEYRHLDS